MNDPKTSIEVVGVMEDGRYVTVTITELFAGEDITSLPGMCHAKMITTVRHGISRIYFKSGKDENGYLKWKAFDDRMRLMYSFKTRADGTRI
ncbi:MAG: hypothetical protein E6R03_18320 [Hyphomicrobiaceae bacterium]|nr:MAG: hypothetical protein E6R03_18320 [Hyphomicrobiaceae bacterium]